MSTPDDARPGGAGEESPLTEAEVERLVRALHGGDASDGSGADDEEPPVGRLALILTPVASAPALAGLCSIAGIDVDVVPSSSGAVAALEVTAEDRTEDWDIAELLGGDDGGFPPAAEELARTLAKLIRAEVVLLVGDLATDVGIETGLSGHLSARRHPPGEEEPAEEVPAGLVLAGADQVVEDLILGRMRPAEVPGHQRSGELPRWKAARLFGRGLRRRKP